MPLPVAGGGHRPDGNLARVVEIGRAEIDRYVVHRLAEAPREAELGRQVGGQLDAVRLEREVERAAVDLDFGAHGGLVRRQCYAAIDVVGVEFAADRDVERLAVGGLRLASTGQVAGQRRDARGRSQQQRHGGRLEPRTLRRRSGDPTPALVDRPMSRRVHDPLRPPRSDEMKVPTPDPDRPGGLRLTPSSRECG